MDGWCANQRDNLELSVTLQVDGRRVCQFCLSVLIWRWWDRAKWWLVWAMFGLIGLDEQVVVMWLLVFLWSVLMLNFAFILRIFSKQKELMVKNKISCRATQTKILLPKRIIVRKTKLIAILFPLEVLSWTRFRLPTFFCFNHVPSASASAI